MVRLGVDVDAIDIRANELIFDTSGRATGKLSRYFPSSSSSSTGIWTSEGKVRVMHDLIEKSARENGGVMKPWTIYIGDSSTDLGCLIDAAVEVGICVRDEVETGEQRGLREALERVGVGCLWIGEWKGRREEGGKCLWWARNLEEVGRGILEGG